MPEMIWVRGESGTIMQFSLPLHPGIQDRLEKGDLVQVTGPEDEPVQPDDSAAPEDVEPLPKRQEPKEAWVRYAVAQGMDLEDVHKMTKHELIEQLRRGEQLSE